MSRESHPAYYLDCCKPFVRLTPSGRVQRFHSFACGESPNKVITESTRRVEVASHALREDDVQYAEYWADRAFEIDGGR